MAERKVIHHPQEPHRPHTVSARHYDPVKHRLWGAPEAEEPEPEEVEEVDEVEESPAPRRRKGGSRA